MKNIFPVSRSAHDALSDELKAAEQERDAATASRMAMEDERDALQQSAYTAECERHTARKERDEAREVLAHALTLLAEVNATRTGGKMWDEKRIALFADANKHGLWGEQEK